MQRTQISLTDADRELLDAVSARTGRSMSALIRDAVHMAYGTQRSADEDLSVMRQARGSWANREVDSATWVDQLRTGARLKQAQP